MSQIQPTNRFTVTKLGALDTATIDMKPLTILCGKNNTGKTWLMYSLYSFIRSEISQLEKVHSIIGQLKENGNYNLNVSDWVRHNFDELRNSVSALNKRELSTAFNADDSLFSETTITWDVDVESLIKNIELSEFKSEIILGNREDTFFLVTKKKGDNLELMLGNNIPDDILNKVISSSIYKACLGHCKGHKNDVFIIPAERNGLHLFYRELSNRRTALLHHASRKELDLASLLKDVLGSKYARPIADYIDWLNSLVDIKNSNKGTSFHHVAEEIKKLIGGKYEVNNDGNIEYIPRKIRNKPSAPKLDLHLSSSTIKSLFGIWFYLEYQAKENSTLMIDKPELNLHPSNQRVIARIIAKLINSNINVVVSTHSDYFIRELNSLIMLGSTNSGDEEVKNNLMKKYSFSSNELLSKDKIAAYVFKDSTLQRMDIGLEGILANTFDEEINSLNESSDDIYYSYVRPESRNEDINE
ncbi:AAA family ATPase [Actinobacillus pleuropneumoniae]|uniref:AAA family ATPase n=1 Tax=Actinobacillus pleuropneumoniae TaxID=715 RepID=UPI003B97F5CB